MEPNQGGGPGAAHPGHLHPAPAVPQGDSFPPLSSSSLNGPPCKTGFDPSYGWFCIEPYLTLHVALSDVTLVPGDDFSVLFQASSREVVSVQDEDA